MEVRFLTAEDASSYWKLRLEALELEPDAFTDSPEAHRALSVEDVAARLSSDPENNFIVGAFHGERLKGSAGFYRVKGGKVRHKGHIWGVYISSEARGLGAGKLMLRALLERAQALQGIEKVLLAVGTTQADAPLSLAGIRVVRLRAPSFEDWRPLRGRGADGAVAQQAVDLAERQQSTPRPFSQDHKSQFQRLRK
jgi:GNAT superfamily N-acetyltransferase